MLDARLLLAYVLGCTPTDVLLRDDDPIDTLAWQRFDALVQQRAQGVPLAYLTGQREFMGLGFVVSPAVLVPRPDTEPLVEWALQWLRHHPQAIVADIGTGSGAIGISVALHAPASWAGSLVASDISPDALAIAAANADRLLQPDRRRRYAVRRGDLTGVLDAPVDLLLANLPYLRPDQIAENTDLRHEPALALAGGDDGLDLIRRTIADLPRVLASGGAVGLEIDPVQADEVQHLLDCQMPDHQVAIVRDLAGDARHVVAEARDRLAESSDDVHSSS